MRVLVVDDNGDLRDLVAQWLRIDGHEVLTADSGEAALVAVDRYGLPDVAVLDVAMPGMDGVDLLGALHAREPRLRALFSTVLWSATDLVRMRAAGGQHLAKPFTANKLRSAVRQLLEQAHDAPMGGAVT